MCLLAVINKRADREVARRKLRISKTPESSPKKRGKTSLEMYPEPFGSNSAQACLNRRISSRLIIDNPLLR